MNSKRRRQCGFSLLELLLAAALGALTTAAVAQLFVSNARAAVLQTGQARLQESARLALHFVAHSARSAGYLGCGPGTLADGLGGTWRGDLTQDLTMAVAGADDVGDADDVSAWELGDRELKPGSDVVLFRRIEGLGHDLAQQFDAGGELTIASTFAAASGQLAVLSGCGQLGVLGIESIARRSGRVALAASVDVDALAPTGVAYGDPAGPAATVLAPVVSEVYFVARGRFVNNRGEPGWSLWRKADRANEVVSGVDDLQVLYGIDTTPNDGDVAPVRYVTADDIGAAVVRSVWIRVTASSVDAVSEDDEPLEQTISQTVALRNPWIADVTARPRAQRGMVLLVSLGLLLSLTLVAVSAAQTTVLELRMARNGRDAALAFHAAEAALSDAESAIVAGTVSALSARAYGAPPPWQSHDWPDSESAYVVEAVATVGETPASEVAVFRVTARGQGPGSAVAWLQTTYGLANASGADPRMTGRLSWVALSAW